MKVTRVSYRHPEAKSQFSESLHQTGFAVLTDHPIAPELIRDVFADWAEFFRSGDKARYTFKPGNQEGYFPFRSENAKDSKVKDLKEFFHLYPSTPIPEGLSGHTQNFRDQLNALGTELLSWLETPEMPLVAMVQNSNETLLRPIHYPPLSGGEEAGAVRAAAHEDINLITLLPAASAPGLEVKDLNAHWHAVECNPGDIVINAGDMLQECSKRYYISTTHQVVNPSGEQAKMPRYSMPLFIHPRPEVRLSDRYTSRQYLEERLREIGLLKANENKTT